MDSPWAPYLTSHHPPAAYQRRPPRHQVLRRRQPVPNGGGCARGERSRVAAAQRTAAWQVGKIASVRQVSYGAVGGAVGDRSGEAARRSSGTSMTTDKRPWSAPVPAAWIVRPWQTTTHGFLHEWQVTGGCSSTQDVCWTMPSFKRPDRKGWCCPCPSPSCCIKDGTACRSAGGAGTEGERQRTGEEQQQVQAVQDQGPLERELPVNVQKGLFKYLEQRGITLSATNYMHDYTMTKQAKEYIRWMTKLKDFVRQ